MHFRIAVLGLIFNAFLFGQNTAQLIRVSLTGQPPGSPLWVLEITAPDFTVTQNTTEPDGRRSLLASQGAGSVLEITIERVAARASLDGCRERFSRIIGEAAPLRMTHIRQSQSGTIAVMEYEVPVIAGEPIMRKNVYGCMAKDDAYVDIHLSKTPFADSDEEPLMAILSSATIVDADSLVDANTEPEK